MFGRECSTGECLTRCLGYGSEAEGGGGGGGLTDASLSKRAKSSLRVMTSSWAVHWDARLVKPSMSANRMLPDARATWAQRRRRGRGERREGKNILKVMIRNKKTVFF